MHGSLFTFDLSIQIEIFHALLAVSMPNILLVLLQCVLIVQGILSPYLEVPLVAFFFKLTINCG